MEPSGPGEPVGPQQLTGKPPIGSGLFCWLLCSLRERLGEGWRGRYNNNNDAVVVDAKQIKKQSTTQVSLFPLLTC